MRRVLIIPIALLFFVSFAHVSPVQACTGIPRDFTPLYMALQNYESVAVGRIHTVSYSGVNAVLHVDQVIKGEQTSEFIVFTRNRPEDIAFRERGRGLPVRCDTFGVKIPSGRRFIAGLWRYEQFGNYDGTLITEDKNGIFWARNPDNPEEYLPFTYDEVIAYAAQQVNETPRKPPHGSISRPAALNLYTESGELYILPVDKLAPHPEISMYPPPMTEPECTPYVPAPCLDYVEAPNGVDSAAFYPVGSNVEEYMHVDTTIVTATEGETGVFSANSDLLAVWAGQELRVYSTTRQASLENGWHGLNLLRTLVIHPLDPVYSGAGAWHPDGRTFAFSTEAGVWLWDIMPSEPAPSLLLPTTDTPIRVRHFSPAGNFLAVESGSRRYHVDVNTLVEYPDGLFSPDERLLAVYDTAAGGLTPMQIYTLIPEFKVMIWWEHYVEDIAQFEWIDINTYLYAACGDPILQPEMPPGFDKPWCKIRAGLLGPSGGMKIAEYDAIDGVLFDYDPVTGSLVTLIDGDTITFNGEVLEMAGIDSAIVDVELIPLIDMEYSKF